MSVFALLAARLVPFPAAREQIRAAGVLFTRDQRTPDRGTAEEGEGDPDGALVMAARNGDDHAFEQIVRKYQGRAYNIAFRMLSDGEEARDLTQEVFIKVYRSLKSFRSESRFSRWFFTILLNSCRSRLKHLKRRGFFRSEPVEDPLPEGGGPPRQYADDSPDASTLLERRQLEEIVHAKIALVPEEFRDVLVLRDIQDFSYEEIAAVLDLNIGTVKSRLHRGRMALKDLLSGEIEGLV